jgi:Asp/Glu/hydantoin racemase
MTSALRPAIDALNLPLTTTYFTCPAPGIPSINSPADSKKSAKLCFPHVQPLVPDHDLFLVACYSHHPLVAMLKAECASQQSKGGDSGRRKYVTGIFEASALASLSMLAEDERFGIVSTGKAWEDGLMEAVHAFFGGKGLERYAGTETTGLNATELHDLPAEEVQRKMKQATRRLLKEGKVGAVCLGCAGMVGLEEAVREGCIEELGEERGGRVYIVDGVQAGTAQLFGNARLGF